MKSYLLLITTMLSALLVLGVAACTNADSMTSSNAKTVGHPVEEQSVLNARDIAEDFIGHINYARIALARNKGDRAEIHIAEARHLLNQMKDTTVEERRVESITSGRVVYNYDTDYKYHYFPISVGPMEIKKMGHGPAWAKGDLAVTEAEIVYLTVDLSGDAAPNRLNEAEAEIKKGDFHDADIALARLTDEIITVDAKVSVPVDKARDNILLTRNFITAGNYAGARYALKHADDALDEMQKDDTYATHHDEIISMRKDVNHLQHVITKKDPTMMNKAGAKLDKWWNKLKDWSENH